MELIRDNVNTKIEYLYRDADNYKVWNECIIKGPITEEQKNRIISCLDDGEYFIPQMVGLPAKQFDKWDEQSDHPFFELYEDSFSPTSEKPTIAITAAELVSSFERCKDRWNDVALDFGQARVTDNLIKAMIAYGMEFSWNDSEIIDALSELGITYEDFCRAGAEDFVKDYFNDSSERKDTDTFGVKPSLSSQIQSAETRTAASCSTDKVPERAPNAER